MNRRNFFKVLGLGVGALAGGAAMTLLPKRKSRMATQMGKTRAGFEKLSESFRRLNEATGRAAVAQANFQRLVTLELRKDLPPTQAKVDALMSRLARETA